MTALVMIATLAPLAQAAPPTPSSLKLFTASDEVTLTKFGRRVFLDLGAWITPVGGSLEFWVSRADYDSPVTIRQVDPETKETVRELPSDVLADSWFGFADFLSISLTDAEGAVTEVPSTSFCPNSYERNRVNDQGPASSSYPVFCASYAPFTRGMVWGLDEHWAANLAGGFEGGGELPVVRIEPGEYTATISITPRYVDLLAISPQDATATVALTVLEGRDRGGKCCHPVPLPRPSGKQRPMQNIPTVTDPDPSTLPDLVALPLWSIWTDARKKKDLLTFAATPWNEGPAPLWVEGFRRSDESVMDAFQYFTDADGEVVGRAPVGDLIYDQRRGHNHWHFTQFARYTLLDAQTNEVVASKKQTFCIAPTDAIDLTVPRANWRGWTEDFYTQCGNPSSLWVREVLEPGWGDTYYQSVAGQAFNITNVPNGWYTLVSEVDPEDRIYQADHTNDLETRLVYIGGKPGARRVKVAPWHGIEI